MDSGAVMWLCRRSHTDGAKVRVARGKRGPSRGRSVPLFALRRQRLRIFAIGHEIIFVAQQFGAIHCYLHLARFRIHPLLWSPGRFFLAPSCSTLVFFEGRVVW